MFVSEFRFFLQIGESSKLQTTMIGKIIGFIWRKIPRRLRLKTVRVSQAKFVVSVGGLIINENGEILLLSHVLRAAKLNWGNSRRLYQLRRNSPPMLYGANSKKKLICRLKICN